MTIIKQLFLAALLFITHIETIYDIRNFSFQISKKRIKEPLRNYTTCTAKALHKADSYNSSKGRFFIWILNISRNAAIDKTRSKSFKNSSKNLNADYFVDILPTQDNLDNSTDAIGIAKFVGKLAEKCKKVIDLLYFKGYTQKEASETLDMPIGTIKTHNRNCIKLKWNIASGILELYVAGSLSEAENKEVYNMMLEHPEVLQEVLDIEAAGGSVSPTLE